MEIIENFEVKPLAQCTAGELIRFEINQRGILAITVVPADDTDRMTILVLEAEDPDVETGWVDRFNANDDLCTSYGMDWVLELLDNSVSWPGNELGSNSPGAIRRYQNSIGMITRGNDGRNMQQLGILDLNELRPITRDRHQGTLISHWRIWANEAHRVRRDSQPIMEFELDE